MIIKWAVPDGSTAVTTLVEATDATAEAKRLQKLGLIPSDWTYEVVEETNPATLPTPAPSPAKA